MGHNFHPSFQNLLNVFEEVNQLRSLRSFLFFFLSHEIVLPQSCSNQFFRLIPNCNHFLVLTELHRVFWNFLLLVIGNVALILRVYYRVHIFLYQILSHFMYICSVFFQSLLLKVILIDFGSYDGLEEAMIPVQFQIFEVLKHGYLLQMLNVLFSKVQMDVFLHLQYSSRFNHLW